MRMDAPDTPEAPLSQTELREVRDHDLLLVPYDDMLDGPLAIYDQADLTAYFKRQGRQIPGQLA